MPDAPQQSGVIEIRLNSVGQLFNSFDPSPFQARDLDDDAEEFIIGWALEHRRADKLRIVVHLPPEECEKEGAKTLAEAVAQHFSYRADVLKRELAELFRQGRLYLFVGLSIFVACMLAAQGLRSMFPDNGVAVAFEQGLIIVGWVANWKPFEVLIYDWWPMRRRIRLFKKLAQAEIEVRPASGSARHGQ